jgi:hypothetical protein
MSQWHLLTSAHVLKFFFETLTDVSFLPGLVVLGKRGRSFETFIGIAQFITSFFYNVSARVSPLVQPPVRLCVY